MHDTSPQPAGDAQTLQVKERGMAWLTLFASTGTLICCALPIVLVTLGWGAAVAALTSAFPFLITLSQHKEWVFAGSGAMLLLSGWLMYRPLQRCPADPERGRACERSRAWSRRIFWGSVAVWGIGFFAAYLALPIRIGLGF